MELEILHRPTKLTAPPVALEHCPGDEFIIGLFTFGSCHALRAASSLNCCVGNSLAQARCNQVALLKFCPSRRAKRSRFHNNKYTTFNIRVHKLSTFVFSFLHIHCALWSCHESRKEGFHRLSSEPPELREELELIADAESRSVSQICELLLRGGVEIYRKDGHKYMQRLLAHQRQE